MAMNQLELRIELTDEMARELLWRALLPDAIVLTNTLNEAIARQQELREVSLEGYQLTGISITTENGAMYAELTYAQVSREAGA
jgi:hypothetical protein